MSNKEVWDAKAVRYQKLAARNYAAARQDYIEFSNFDVTKRPTVIANQDFGASFAALSRYYAALARGESKREIVKWTDA